MTVGALKQFCKALNIDIDNLEMKGYILSPRGYPFDMMSKSLVKLKTHLGNEGKLTRGYKSARVLGYSNQDPVLLKYFADTVRDAGGIIRGNPCLSTYALEIFSPAVLARVLEASGYPLGRKTRSNPSLDPLVGQDPELFRYHIQATLTEEGWPTLRISNNRARFVIGWGRSVDITDLFSKEQTETLRLTIKERRKRKIGIRSIKDYQIMNIINQRSPTLLKQELDLLGNAHKEKEWPERYPTRVHLSKKGRVTVFWEVGINDHELIDIIHNEYGMLPGTWKAKRFERLYKAYIEYRGRKLSNEEIFEIGKVKEENPHKIPVEWVSEKVQELFQGAQWGKDIERIRRKLGRREEE